jgi:hypothetical protein
MLRSIRVLKRTKTTMALLAARQLRQRRIYCRNRASFALVYCKQSSAAQSESTCGLPDGLQVFPGERRQLGQCRRLRLIVQVVLRPSPGHRRQLLEGSGR